MLVFVRSFSYTPRASISEESLTLLVVVPVRCFSYTPHAGLTEEFLIPSLRLLDQREFSLSLIFCSCRIQTCFSYTIIVTTTQIRSQMLCLDQTNMQEQGLTGYSSVRLTSRASHRLGKCRLSWVWLGLGLLSALSECNACVGRGNHRHASSGFVSVLTDQTAQSWHDLVRTSVFLFTLIVLFSEELLLHSSSWF